MSTNMFERATRKQLRFASDRGDLSVEQLWTLPLTRRSPQVTDLDGLARAVNAELRSVTEESFVVTNPDPRKGDLELKLEILKHIISVKLQDAETAKTAADRAARKQQLLEILSRKEDEALSSMSRDEIMAELEKVS